MNVVPGPYNGLMQTAAPPGDVHTQAMNLALATAAAAQQSAELMTAGAAMKTAGVPASPQPQPGHAGATMATPAYGLPSAPSMAMYPTQPQPISTTTPAHSPHVSNVHLTTLMPQSTTFMAPPAPMQVTSAPMQAGSGDLIYQPSAMPPPSQSARAV